MHILIKLGVITLLVLTPQLTQAQSSLGFSIKNYALEPAQSPQVLHIPVTASDVSYGLTYSKEKIYKDLDLNVYTGIYLAQQGFGEFMGISTLSQESTGRTGRRHFLDLGITIGKPVLSKKRFSLKAFVEPQILIALDDATFIRPVNGTSTSFYQTYQVEVFRETFYTTQRNPVNLFMNYGFSVDYKVKWLPLVLSSRLSFRDFIGDYFTKIDITTVSRLIGPTVDDARVDILQIQSSGNAIGYSFSVRYAF
jgi:hypothetical protein